MKTSLAILLLALPGCQVLTGTAAPMAGAAVGLLIGGPAGAIGGAGVGGLAAEALDSSESSLPSPVTDTAIVLTQSFDLMKVALIVLAILAFLLPSPIKRLLSRANTVP